jgi:hypothetical protein
MRKLFILFSLVIGLCFVSTANAQTPIVFGKVAKEKIITITVRANRTNKYSISLKKNQVVNMAVEGDIGVSRDNDFPVISLNLTNGIENVDQSQDDEGTLSILAGRNGKFIISVFNSDKKRARTFRLKLVLSNDKAAFAGGEPVSN